VTHSANRPQAGFLCPPRAGVFVFRGSTVTKKNKYHDFDQSALNDPVRAGFSPAGTCNWYQIAGAAIAGVAGSRTSRQGKKLMKEQRRAIYQQRMIQKEEYENYKTHYLPVLQKYAAEASEGVKADIDGVTSRASADVVQAFDKARGIARRNMLRYGANPGDANFAENERKFALEQAKADAMGVNTARETERRYADETTRRMRENVMNFARGIPGQSAGIAGSAAQGYGNMANQSLQDAAGVSRFVAGLPWDKIGNKVFSRPGGVPTYAGNTYADPSTALHFAEQDALFKADGGPVEGPGTETSDSIPARLSDGEYVIPADVVKKKGTEFFDKLLDKHHTPVAARPDGYANGGFARGMPMFQRFRQMKAAAAPAAPAPVGFRGLTRTGGLPMFQRFRQMKAAAAPAAPAPVGFRGLTRTGGLPMYSLGVIGFADGGEVDTEKDEELRRAREFTEDVADKDKVPGAQNTKKLRERVAKALEEVGVY